MKQHPSADCLHHRASIKLKFLKMMKNR